MEPMGKALLQRPHGAPWGFGELHRSKSFWRTRLAVLGFNWVFLGGLGLSGVWGLGFRAFGVQGFGVSGFWGAGV